MTNALSRAPGSNTGHLTVSVAHTLNDLMHVMAVRTLVYMGEQACPYDEEYDGNDFAGSTHLILRCDGEPVGVVRLRWFAGFAKLERSARKGYARLMGHAQDRVIPFWRRYFKGRVRENRPRFFFSEHGYTELEFDLTPVPGAISIDSDPLVLIRPEGEWDRPGVLDRSAAMRAA